jgi:putative aldouronate transport system permease protein
LKDAGKSAVLSKKKWVQRLKRDYKINKCLYLMAIPIILYYIIFHYLPMFGIVIAFQDYRASVGVLGSKWVGLKNFVDFFNSVYFVRLLRNTFLLSIYQLLWTFPVPILFALLLNEIRSTRFKRMVQTISYMPHFISLVVVAGMLTQFLSSNGFISQIVAQQTGKPVNLLMDPKCFRTIYIASGLWQQLGWKSIIYISALSAIDPQLYEVASIDGANKLSKMLHVTIPGILPTIVILLIMDIGKIMTIGFQKIILLYNPNTYEVADVISSYVYRVGLAGNLQFSYTTAIELVGSIINVSLLILANKISQRVSETSLW